MKGELIKDIEGLIDVYRLIGLCLLVIGVLKVEG